MHPLFTIAVLSSQGLSLSLARASTRHDPGRALTFARIAMKGWGQTGGWESGWGKGGWAGDAGWGKGGAGWGNGGKGKSYGKGKDGEVLAEKKEKDDEYAADGDNSAASLFQPRKPTPSAKKDASSASEEKKDKKNKKRRKKDKSSASETEADKKEKKKTKKKKPAKKRSSSSSSSETSEKKKKKASKILPALCVQLSKEAAAAYATWPHGDVQRFTAETTTLRQSVSNVKGGTMATEDFLKLCDQIPQRILDTQPVLKRRVQNLAGKTEMSNVTAFGLAHAMVTLGNELEAFYAGHLG